MAAPLTPPRHWAAINELGGVKGMRLLFWIGRVGGRWPFRLVLYPVLGWYLLTKPAARRASDVRQSWSRSMPAAERTESAAGKSS